MHHQTRDKVNYCPSVCWAVLLGNNVLLSGKRLPANSEYAPYKGCLDWRIAHENHKCWVQWAIPLLGLSGVDWITPWLQALHVCGLPGRDFIALGLRKNGSEWGKYHVEYCDMGMMYHYILMNEMKLSAKQAAEYSIHGLKHFLITAATQLEVERTAIDKLGHWHHASKMHDKYNQSKCVQ